jgi:hypothetical protein
MEKKVQKCEKKGKKCDANVMRKRCDAMGFDKSANANAKTFYTTIPVLNRTK